MSAYHIENIQHCAFGLHRTSAEGKVRGEPAQSVSRRPASAHGNRPPLKLLPHAYATRTTICSCGFTCIQSECPQRTQIFSEVNRLMRGGGLACDCRRSSQLVLIRSPPFSCSTDAHLVIQGLTLVDRTFRDRSPGHFLDTTEHSGTTTRRSGATPEFRSKPHRWSRIARRSSPSRHTTDHAVRPRFSQRRPS